MDPETSGVPGSDLGKHRRLHPGTCSGAQMHLKIIGLFVVQDPAGNKRRVVSGCGTKCGVKVPHSSTVSCFLVLSLWG